MNRNIKVRPLTNEPYFSFENFMFSNLTKVTTEEKMCLLCKRTTTEAYLYKDISFYSHYECLSLYFLYQFFQMTKDKRSETSESTISKEGEPEEPQVKPSKNESLYNLYNINMNESSENERVNEETGEERMCYSCGLGDVYFKCLLEDCEKYVHLDCSGSGNIMVHTNPLLNLNLYITLRNKSMEALKEGRGDANGNKDLLKDQQEKEMVMDDYIRKNVINVKEKLVSYRFLLCYKHINQETINNIKVLFLYKLMQVKEYQQVCGIINLITSSTSVGQGKSKEDGKKDDKNAKTYMFKGRSQSQVFQPAGSKSFTSMKPSYQNSFEGRNRVEMMMEKERSQSESYISKREQGLLRSEQEMIRKREGKKNIMLINNLIYEYNLYKRSNTPRTNKPINTSNFNILFLPITKASLSSASNGGVVMGMKEDEVMEKDIKLLLNVNNNIESIDELKKISIVNEVNIQNIVNIVRQLLYPTGGGTQESEGNGNQSKMTSTPVEIEIEELQEKDVYRLMYKRPKFAVLKIYNKYIWMSMTKMSKVDAGRNGEELVKVKEELNYETVNGNYLKEEEVGEEINSANKESKLVILEYLVLNVMEYLYLKRVIRCIYNYKNNIILMLLNQKPEKREEKSTSEKEKEEVINLCGYSWDINPPLYKLHKSQGNRTREVKEDPEGKKEEDFVYRQSVALMKALKSINQNIEKYKKNIEVNIQKDSYKYKNMCFNVGYVNFFQSVSIALHRYNHFKNSMKRAIIYYNQVNNREDMEKEGEGTESTKGAKKTLTEKEKEKKVEENEEGLQGEGEDQPKIKKEYCSVCLMSELSHKHILMQCQKCYLRVHYKCYHNYQSTNGTTNTGTNSPKTSTTGNTAKTTQSSEGKEKEQQNKGGFYCDPCSIEYNQRYETNYNSAICISCLSSGGAMKSIYVPTSSYGGQLTPKSKNARAREKGEDEKWIHLICLAFIMPKVMCYDFNNLNQWYVHNSLNTMSTCSVCGVVGGIQVNCCYKGIRHEGAMNHERMNNGGINSGMEANFYRANMNGMGYGEGMSERGERSPKYTREQEVRCDLKFHPMCCLLSGCYIRYSEKNHLNLKKFQLKAFVNNFFNSSFNRDMYNTTKENIANWEEGVLANLFQSIILEPLCMKHTSQVYGEKFMSEQLAKRCFAYTHYLYSPDGFKNKKKYNSLPLEPIYSPVTITRNGPIKSQPRIMPQHYTKKFTLDNMNKRFKYNEPYLISVIYGLPKNLCGDLPKYGITAITNYLSSNVNASNGGNRNNHLNKNDLNNRELMDNREDRAWYNKNHQGYMVNK